MPFQSHLNAFTRCSAPSSHTLHHQESVNGVWMYGDPKSHELRLALAAHNQVEPANLVVGEGIDGLMSLTAHLLISPGDSVVTSHGTYPTLNYFVAGRGGVLHTVPYGADDRHDLIGLLAKAAEVKAKIIYLVNPDNPSGTWHPAANIEAMIEGLPQGVSSDGFEPKVWLQLLSSPRKLSSVTLSAVPVPFPNLADVAATRRGLSGARPAQCEAEDRRGGSARTQVPHFLQGVWHGWRAHRLCAWSAGNHHELRQNPQPLRHRPHESGKPGSA